MPGYFEYAWIVMADLCEPRCVPNIYCVCDACACACVCVCESVCVCVCVCACVCGFQCRGSAVAVWSVIKSKIV